MLWVILWIESLTRYFDRVFLREASNLLFTFMTVNEKTQVILCWKAENKHSRPCLQGFESDTYRQVFSEIRENEWYASVRDDHSCQLKPSLLFLTTSNGITERIRFSKYLASVFQILRMGSGNLVSQRRECYYLFMKPKISWLNFLARLGIFFSFHSLVSELPLAKVYQLLIYYSLVFNLWFSVSLKEEVTSNFI